ncbi:MAG: phage portal protein [Chitinophagaceae bacterium]|nr:phage portal protein [Rubrivivax sp.]
MPAYAAVKVISETISTLPLHQFTRRPDGAQSQASLSKVIDSPADGSMTIDWLQRMVVSMLTSHGAVGLLSGVGANGWPLACTWVDPTRLTGELDRGVAKYWLDGRPIASEDLLYIPSMVIPGQALGVSPAGYFASTFAAAREAQEANRDWSKSRAVPSSTLQNTAQTLDPAAAEALSDRASSRIRNGKPFVYGKDWKFDVLSMAAGDVAFLDSIKANATQIAAIYSIPPEMIGGETGNSLTYSTVEQNAIKFLTFTIQPWLRKIEQALSARLMPRPQFLKFNADALLRVDTTTRISAYRTYREIGLRSLDELRILDDLEPLPNGEGQSFAPLAQAPKGVPTS